MNFSEYEKNAEKTNTYLNINEGMYGLVFGLLEESGEIAGKFKRKIRGDSRQYTNEEIAQELGDCLWYITIISNRLGYSLEQVAEMNITKLRDRQERGVIKSNGDTR